MATKADFSDEEWDAIVHGPPGAGLVVMVAESGGQLRETTAIARAYAAAREDDEVSGLLAEIVAEQPEIDSPRSASPDDLEQLNLDRLRTAVALLRERATDQDVEDYQLFTMLIADRVAHAHREGFLGLSGDEVSVSELSAVARVRTAVA